MDIRTSRVEAHHLIVGVGGKNIGPGQPVDLDEEIAPNVRVRDVFPEEYFEAPAVTLLALTPPATAADQDKD